MDMFTLKQTHDHWIACCRACGHEQALPETSAAQMPVEGVAIQCERCPSQEPCVYPNETAAPVN
ncbi:hypothetical protein EVC62_13340 [Salinicola endophyticus]|uniref:Uncharacterized protein n=1 Tax=Salinicola endophyticus TaxID=1949083 RepID=A0ABY8FIG0_9GAMM|nr:MULTISPECIES: hypothetical protein [Salinicola]WFF42412.1 hypothetical protein EVC62_13340 [Salinicola endophyticus]